MILVIGVLSEYSIKYTSSDISRCIRPPWKVDPTIELSTVSSSNHHLYEKWGIAHLNLHLIMSSVLSHLRKLKMVSTEVACIHMVQEKWFPIPLTRRSCLSRRLRLALDMSEEWEMSDVENVYSWCYLSPVRSWSAVGKHLTCTWLYLNPQRLLFSYFVGAFRIAELDSLIQILFLVNDQ